MHKTPTKSKHAHASNLHRDYENIKTILAGTTQDLKGSARELWSHSVDKSADVKDGIGNYIANKPFQSIGIAALTGLVIGYFIHK